MNEPLLVKLSLKEGPVIFSDATVDAINETYDLWEGAVASEYFPPKANSGFYVITLEKSAHRFEDVRDVEQNLTEALLLLATAWPFSGGSQMPLESRQLIKTPRYTSNAEDVEEEFLARGGRHRVIAYSSGAISIIEATYARPPLRYAIRIANHMRQNPVTRQLLSYYYQAWTVFYHAASINEAPWFVHLYKIRELLKDHYGGEVAARRILEISATEWNEFGRLQNNYDLRHAEKTGKSEKISWEAMNQVYHAAGRWISMYLCDQGLPVVRWR
jgi:hypothetical protein